MGRAPHMWSLEKQVVAGSNQKNCRSFASLLACAHCSKQPTHSTVRNQKQWTAWTFLNPIEQVWSCYAKLLCEQCFGNTILHRTIDSIGGKWKVVVGSGFEPEKA